MVRTVQSVPAFAAAESVRERSGACLCRFVPAPSELAAMDEGAQGALSVLTYRVRSLAGGRRPALRSQKHGCTQGVNTISLPTHILKYKNGVLVL